MAYNSTYEIDETRLLYSVVNKTIKQTQVK